MKNIKKLNPFDLNGLKKLITLKLIISPALVFLIIISIPCIFHLAGLNEKFFSYDFHDNDKSRLLKKPELSAGAIFPFFKKYEKYYNSIFPMRNYLIRNFNNIRFKISNRSPVEDVIIGKRGWLFLKRENGRDLLGKYLSGNNMKSFRYNDLLRILKERSNIAAEEQITYLFVIAPDKWTVYPEMMPNGINKNREANPNESLSTRLKRDGINAVTGIRKRLLKMKARGRLYRPADTHWNDLGAFYAYRKIISSLSSVEKRNIRPALLRYFYIKKNRADEKPDLERMLNLDSYQIKNEIIELKKRKGECLSVENEKSKIPGFPDVISNPNGKFSTLLFIHDSFGEYLKKFLCIHFKKIYLSTDRNILKNRDMLKKMGIKYVIEEVVERHLLSKGAAVLY